MQVSGLSISFADAAHLVFSTLLSVSVHEFGHAIAAARLVSDKAASHINIVNS